MSKPTNKQIAVILNEIADILEMNDEMVFKIRAYRKAAREIEEYSEKVADIQDMKRLTQIPGVGEGIASKINEISETGTSEYYEQLKNTVPANISTLNRVEGVGPKTIKRLYDKLGVRTLKDLENAAKGEKIRELEGFGIKTEENILKGIAAVRKNKGRYRLDEAYNYARTVLEKMRMHEDTIQIEIAGSLRRRKETIGDMDLLISSKNNSRSIKYFTSLEEISRILAKGDTKATIEFDNGFQADLRVVEDASFGAALQYFTGDKSHNVKLRKIAIKKSFKLNEYGLFSKDKNIASKTEKEIYKKLGMQTPPAEIRRDCGEIEAARESSLPTLIKTGDIKGDLQMHTNMSDGINTAQELAYKAEKLGYEYIAITEHNTEGLEVAGGISSKEFGKYLEKLESVKSKVKILKSLEVNIDKDGSLTVPDKHLRQLDYVLVAIHSHFRLSKKEMTKRILKAFENPYVHALAHPTGRLLLRREPYEIDFELICKKAKEKNILLEINAHPERLDLDGEYSKIAKDFGCKLCIGTDSHSTLQLDNMKYGVFMAKRGWLTKENVINTASYKELKKLFKKKIA